MAVLVWLLIPVAGALVAGLWSAWAVRYRTGAGGIADAAGVRGYDRFRAAMERSPSRPPDGPRPTAEGPFPYCQDMPRRTATLLTSTLLLIALLTAGVLVKVPYSEMSPGPTVNTLGEYSGEPVLSIEGHETYEATGHLNMTTVRVTGINYRMNLLEAMGGWLAGDRAVVPHRTLYPEDVSADEVEQENAEQFSRSQESAKVAALNQLGIEYSTQTIVDSVVKDSPSEGRLHAGDAIVAVDGTKISDPAQVAEEVTKHTAGEDVVFTIVPAEAAEAARDAGRTCPPGPRTSPSPPARPTTTGAPSWGSWPGWRTPSRSPWTSSWPMSAAPAPG